MDSKGKILSINFKTICRYLNELLGTPRKIRKYIFLTEKKRNRESNFAKIFYQGDYLLKTLCSQMKQKLIWEVILMTTSDCLQKLEKN